MKLQVKLSDLLDGDKEYLTRDLGEARKYIHELEDLQYRWQEAWRQMRDTHDKRGIKMLDIPTLTPDESIIKFYEKAARM